MGLGYMWIRFGAPYNGVTATPAGMKRPVYVQSTWYVLCLGEAVLGEHSLGALTRLCLPCCCACSPLATVRAALLTACV